MERFTVAVGWDRGARLVRIGIRLGRGGEVQAASDGKPRRCTGQAAGVAQSLNLRMMIRGKASKV